MNPRKIPTLPAIGALTLIYLAAGKLALQLAFVNAERFSSLASGWNRARCFARVRLSSLARNFYRCVCCKFLDDAKYFVVARHCQRKHARSALRCVAGESICRWNASLRSATKCF